VAVIECNDLRKSYRLGARTVEALRGLDLTIAEPGFFGIMGASGSGKSTLLHLLAGLDTSDGGAVSIAGQRLDEMSEKELTRFRRECIGIVFQQFNLIPTMTARQNVELPGMLAGMGRPALRDRSDALLGRLGMAERSDHRPDALSGGEQQRVAVARALLFAPPVLFADEPTGNLDSETSEQLWGLLGDLAEERGMTVVMVTHEPEAAEHCERVYLIRDGVVSGSIETGSLNASDIATEYQRLSRSA
jgi:putative ABC transport system ATP-binding protein